MKALILISLLSQVAFAQNLVSPNGSKKSSLDDLKKKIVVLITQHAKVNPYEFEDQEVHIGFLINANNEIVIQDVESDSEDACAYIREVLSFRKIKYPDARQLRLYTISIRLKGKGVMLSS